MPDMPWKPLLDATAARARAFLDGLESRAVSPAPESIERLQEFDVPLPQGTARPEEVLERLDRVGSPAAMGSAGGRFFGFVIGGALPAALSASWLASTWDQNAWSTMTSPVAAKLEEVALRWLIDLFELPSETGGAFVTGGTMANFTALAAARHHLLEQAGWDVEAAGLFGAPPITVVVGEEAHPALLKSLAMLGMGRDRVVRIPADEQGRMRTDDWPNLSGPTIVCIQAGNVNTGSFDPAVPVCERANDAGAWVHVDGAFGLWAAAAPARRNLVEGYSDADSWATDCHKWLNVPYDSGLAFVRKAAALRAAMAVSAAYLPPGRDRYPGDYTPELSRRARGVEVWAALYGLGREGLAEMIERCCRHAERFAAGLREVGYGVLNDVVLNQVLVDFGGEEKTRRVIAGIQRDGTCWCGGTVWQGRTAMRISVCSWATTEEDVERSLEAMLRVAAQTI